MKILVVHQYYLRPGQPGGSRFNELARLWAQAGHGVTVIAGTLNYATGEVPERYRGRWLTREMDGDVTVIRCHVPRSYNSSHAGRMWAFFGFTLSALTAVLRTSRPDVVIATSPPLVAAIPAWVVARLRFGRRPKLIFEIRDLWPESAISTGVLKADSMLTRLLYWMERWACSSADLVNVLTPAFRDDLIRRGLATEDRIIFVPNGADSDSFVPGPPSPAIRRELGWGDRFVVMYAGAHGRANALDQMLDAAELLRHRDDILIACVGDGPERVRLSEEVRSRNLSNIVFNGPQPKAAMPDIVRSADAGAAVLARNPTFLTVYPNKVFDYMACEKPTLLAIDGVARELVCEQARGGVFAEPENGRDIADKIIYLADHPEERAAMGQRARTWVMANAMREALADRYLAAMRTLVEGS